MYLKGPFQISGRSRSPNIKSSSPIPSFNSLLRTQTILIFSHNFHSAILGVCSVGVDAPSFQKDLYYPLMPELSHQGEGRPAVSGFDIVRIYALLLQEPLYYPLMPARSRQQEWRLAIIGDCLVRFDLISCQKHLSYLFMSTGGRAP